MRPFLERCADVVQQRADFSTWTHPHCPLCGGEPEFAVRRDRRRPACSSAAGAPAAGSSTTSARSAETTTRSRLPSFSSRDNLYRLYACDVCRRYIKVYDARQGGRPVMLSVDSVATLPLDAAAMQKGYTG